MDSCDTIILGAGAAGLMCAAQASAAGGRVILLDHAKAAGEKIRISGGGRCNFTNMDTGAENFLSQNPHFAKSALARYTQWDFLDLMARHGVGWHEKTLGQLFCTEKSGAIIAMLLGEAARAEIRLSTEIGEIGHDGARFVVATSRGAISAQNLVVATGGKSIPKMGATGLAYQIAERFGHAATETRPGLVPLTFAPHELEWIKPLAGLACPVTARSTGAHPGAFEEAMLFTHRGISGPAILQISSYWREGEEISIRLVPGAYEALRAARGESGRRALASALGDLLPARLTAHLAGAWGLSGNLADASDKRLAEIAAELDDWRLRPSGSEGYRTAEVTLGGVDTGGLSSKDMQSKTVQGLYFIGECVDVTGWLGGYNFQWAWSSGAAAGRAIAANGSARDTARS